VTTGGTGIPGLDFGGSASGDATSTRNAVEDSGGSAPSSFGAIAGGINPLYVVLAVGGVLAYKMMGKHHGGKHGGKSHGKRGK
jgi:hypothetical protein